MDCIVPHRWHGTDAIKAVLRCEVEVVVVGEGIKYLNLDYMLVLEQCLSRSKLVVGLRTQQIGQPQ
jgi:hypothetical protein